MPTSRDLAGAYSKLERAEHHINDLSGCIDLFLAQQPFKLIAHYRRKAGEIAYRVKTKKSIPPELPLILGDAVHNLRTALDMMLFVMARERSPSPSNIQFPFPRKDSDDALTGAINNGQVKFAGKKVEEAIRRLNPSPSGNPILSGIHSLDIRDKHHLLILSRGIPRFVGDTLSALINARPKLNVPVACSGVARLEIGAGGAILMAAPEDQDILKVATRFATRSLADSQEEAKVQPAFAITFGKGQPFADRTILEVLRDAARNVRTALDCLIVAYLDPENAFPT